MPTVIDIQAREERSVSTAARKCLRNTYLLLGISMLPTVLGAAVGVTFPITLALGVIGHLLLFLAILIGMNVLIMRHKDSILGVNLLLLFTFFMGYFLGPILAVALTFSNGVDMIAIAFLGTAATFFVLAGYATATTRNFATPGLWKTMGIGILMAFVLGIVAVAFQMHVLSLAISAVFIPISSMLIVMTLNNIVRGGETNYVMATLTVYIMVYNIFSSLLHLLMAFAGGGRE